MQTSSCFTTDGMAMADRLPYWNEVVSSTFIPSSVQPPRAGEFRASLHNERLGEAELTVVRASPQRVARTSALIRLSSDECLMFGFAPKARWKVSQHGRTVQVAPMQFVLYDSNYPFELEFDEDFDLHVLQLPHASLAFAGSRLSDVAGRPFDAVSGAGKLLASLIEEVRSGHTSSGVIARTSLGSVAVHLATSMVSELLELRTDEANERELRLLRVKSYIELNLANPRLDPHAIASANGMSVRTLHGLFSAEELGVSTYVTHRRLLRCKEDLGNAMHSSLSVAGIAMRWGFWNNAYFSRAFKRMFGISPRSYRIGRRP
ncbi:helix-turn-helix domain protein [Paraburkholderia xenovorans LB400]|uniref:AraC family transcriptional regulator n=4 Tax=Pseudomonadota TaxID=1224 RepID=A0A024HK80_PSEKB|nr:MULTISPECIES: helix-turn-helix domain-containing protein [Pseudomonadota]AIP30215.1 helix-turn-helix domain protein [Paraburkholderia xenovorans LB400]MDD2012829.1 helix-turn-helix domain-containing protein [Pseudomonas putida]CAB3940022.1 Transcriptional activator NphR [Achromobacter insolitus]CAB3948872.1 Transcriptional activator NphR [Achromobacter insolitus]CAE92895.1 putative transcriptional regulator [Pseudomonas putida]